MIRIGLISAAILFLLSLQFEVLAYLMALCGVGAGYAAYRLWEDIKHYKTLVGPIENADARLDAAKIELLQTKNAAARFMQQVRLNKEVVQRESARQEAEFRERMARMAGEEECKKAEIDQEISDLQVKADRRKSDIEKALSLSKSELAAVRQELKVLDTIADQQFVKVYSRQWDFGESSIFEQRLTDLKARLRDLVKGDRAAKMADHGQLATTRNAAANLVVSAFIGMADEIIADVTWKNASKSLEKMQLAFDRVARNASRLEIQVSQDLLSLKTDELTLVHEYREKKQEEAEEQKRLREQMREEEKARREIERAEKEAADEERRVQREIEKARAQQQALAEQERLHRLEIERARADVEAASSAEIIQVTTALAAEEAEKRRLLDERIAALEGALQDAEAKHLRTLSMAQQTKAGYVYVISNVGSFGEDVYKIGMTRRLDPQDRVDELGDASVPFPFDVHAFIWADDAPGLENELHRVFADRRVNMVNNRKAQASPHF